MKNSKQYQYIIGIDPGVNTGCAVWDREMKTFELLGSNSIVMVQKLLLRFLTKGTSFYVRLEDARKRKWFGKSGREQLQGAGSIKRDCQIWEEFFEHYNIPYELVPPKNNKTKLDAKSFAKYTGYKLRTNEHARDAAMLVYGL